MATILISIHKQYSDALFNGTKKFEFRKSAPKQKIDKILVYESKGCGKIVGELIIEDTLTASPKKLWEITHNNAGIDRDSFFRYFADYNTGVAFVVKSYIRYKEPKSLSDFNIKTPPQNYIYIIETASLF